MGTQVNVRSGFSHHFTHFLLKGFQVSLEFNPHRSSIVIGGGHPQVCFLGLDWIFVCQQASYIHFCLDACDRSIFLKFSFSCWNPFCKVQYNCGMYPNITTEYWLKRGGIVICTNELTKDGNKHFARCITKMRNRQCILVKQ